MLHDYLQVYRLSIVLTGEFNPVIVQPFWLASKKLIREAEATTAKVQIIHNDIVQFDLDWVSIEITKRRFEFKTSQEPYFEMVKDLAISIFEILNETPITALGINHIKHYSLRDAAQFYSFGDRLAPLSNWSFLEGPRLFNLEIVEVNRPDALNGNYRIRIYPSDSDGRFGVVFNINDHYAFSSGNSKSNSSDAVKTLASQWKNSSDQAQFVINSLWEKINLD